MMFLAVALAGGRALLFGGEATFDFESPAGLEIVTNIDPAPERIGSTDGNPGGCLAITDAAGGQRTKIIFPDFDDGLIVKAFEFTMDVRVGNGTSGRPADGFSISYARAGDAVLTTSDVSGFSGATEDLPEAGTRSGLVIGFDAWAGNTLPDQADLEGIIIRLDDVTVGSFPLPTRHGEIGDATSAQTAPRGDTAETQGIIDGLAWEEVAVKLDELGKLSVSRKGEALLDEFQTDFFPSPGRLVLAGRTGGANQITHVDNYCTPEKSIHKKTEIFLSGNSCHRPT